MRQEHCQLSSVLLLLLLLILSWLVSVLLSCCVALSRMSPHSICAHFNLTKTHVVSRPLYGLQGKVAVVAVVLSVMHQLSWSLVAAATPSCRCGHVQAVDDVWTKLGSRICMEICCFCSAQVGFRPAIESGPAA